MAVTADAAHDVGVHPGPVAEAEPPHRAAVAEAEAVVDADGPLVDLEHDQPEAGEIEPVVGEVDQFGAAATSTVGRPRRPQEAWQRPAPDTAGWRCCASFSDIPGRPPEWAFGLDPASWAGSSTAVGERSAPGAGMADPADDPCSAALPPMSRLDNVASLRFRLRLRARRVRRARCGVGRGRSSPASRVRRARRGGDSGGSAGSPGCR